MRTQFASHIFLTKFCFDLPVLSSSFKPLTRIQSWEQLSMAPLLPKLPIITSSGGQLLTLVSTKPYSFHKLPRSSEGAKYPVVLSNLLCFTILQVELAVFLLEVLVDRIGHIDMLHIPRGCHAPQRQQVEVSKAFKTRADKKRRPPTFGDFGSKLHVKALTRSSRSSSTINKIRFNGCRD